MILVVNSWGVKKINKSQTMFRVRVRVRVRATVT